MFNIDYGFHFTTRLNVFWLCKFLLAEAKLKLFPLIFLFIFAYSFQRAIVLPVTYLKRNTWSFLVVWVILCSSIHDFIVRNCRFFSHIWETYFSYSEKLVVPNLWPSVYIIHNMSKGLATSYFLKGSNIYKLSENILKIFVLYCDYALNGYHFTRYEGNNTYKTDIKRKNV